MKKILQNIPMSKIVPDPDQPRKSTGSVVISELADNIREHGLINSIEVTKDGDKFRICTGELRWRACKELGWAEMQCQVIDDLKPQDRFVRQLSENVARNSMNPMDVAHAIEKLTHVGLSTLKISKKIGISESSVNRFLSNLKASKPIQKAIGLGKIPITSGATIQSTPNEYKKIVSTKILKGELGDRDATRAIVLRIKEVPEKANEILAHDFSGKDEFYVRQKLAEIAPDLRDLHDEEKNYFRKVQAASKHLHGLLEQNPFGDEKVKYILDIPKKKLVIYLNELPLMINRWIRGFEKSKIIEQSVIEGEIA